MLRAYVKGSDGKFHHCEVLGICPSSFHLFPLVYVKAVRGYPFNESRFAQVEMKASLFYYESAVIPVTSTPHCYRTKGLDTYGGKK